MRDRFTLSLQQRNPVMGDLAGNRQMAEAAIEAAGAVDLVVFGELFICGYPPEDLVLDPAFVAAAMAEVAALAARFPDGPAIAIGTPWQEGATLTNALAVLIGGKVHAVRHKVELSDSALFDERRLFVPGPMPGPVDIEGVRIGFAIGTDLAVEDVCECLAETGAEFLVVANASAYSREAWDERVALAVARVVESELPLVFVNQVGGQDELVFDGASFVLAGDRSLRLQLPAFREAAETLLLRRTDGGFAPERGPLANRPTPEEADWMAATFGLRDYVGKNGFPGVVLNLAGLDAALAAALAVDALGPDAVHGLILPDAATAGETLADAADLARRLAIRCETLPLASAIAGFEAALGPVGGAAGAILRRVRGTMMMAIAEATGALVLAPLGAADLSLGTPSPDGEPSGAFNPVGDFHADDIMRLCRWRNAHRPEGVLGPDGAVIPRRIIETAAHPDDAGRSRDTILRRLIEGASAADLLAEGHEAASVRQVEDRLRMSELQRRQAAPGVRLAPRRFGRDRRTPITNRYRDA